MYRIQCLQRRVDLLPLDESDAEVMSPIDDFQLSWLCKRLMCISLLAYDVQSSICTQVVVVLALVMNAC